MRLSRLCVGAALACAAAAQAAAELRVTEVMYDPQSNEGVWEWSEVQNTGMVDVDLDGYLMDLVGDPKPSSSIIAPSIERIVVVEDEVIFNPTVVPAGGVAVLYDGTDLAYDPDRFRRAWGNVPGDATLIGVERWIQLTNTPEPPTVDPSLPGLTIGFWRDQDAYVEVWLEKEALAGVLYQATSQWDIPLMVTRGYSSLSYLHRLPANAIKIDRAFVQRLGVDAEAASIVRTILLLARQLGLTAIAEGI